LVHKQFHKNATEDLNSESRDRTQLPFSLCSSFYVIKYGWVKCTQTRTSVRRHHLDAMSNCTEIFMAFSRAIRPYFSLLHDSGLLSHEFILWLLTEPTIFSDISELGYIIHVRILSVTLVIKNTECNFTQITSNIQF
jgi:hypothetical protein